MSFRLIGYLEATAVFLIYFFAWHSSLESTTEEYCTQNPRTDQENCSTYDVTLVALLKLGRFFDDHNGAFVALFTLALVLSTAALWWVTKQTAEATEASTQTIINRERARLLAGNATARFERLELNEETGIGRYIIEVNCQFLNFGATPARINKCRIKILADSAELPERVTLRDCRPNVGYFQIAIAPNAWGADLADTVEFFATHEEFEARWLAKPGSPLFFVVGSATFKDVFDVVRTFVFAMKYTNGHFVPTRGESYNKEYEPYYEDLTEE